MAKIDSEDKGINDSNNETFQEVLDARLSRRGFVGGGLATAATLGLGGVGALLKAVPASAHGGRAAGHCSAFRASMCRPPTRSRYRRDTRLTCSLRGAIPCQTGRSSSRMPATARPTRRSSGARTTMAWCISRLTARGTASSHRTTSTPTKVSCSLTASPTGTRKRPDKSLNAHGVSIIEIRKGRQRDDDHHDRRRWRRPWPSRTRDWHVVRRSRYARRITGQTPMRIGGPAAGDDRLKTYDDPTGKTGPRNPQQLRDGIYAVGHLSHVRRELQRLFLSDHESGSAKRPRKAVRHQSLQWRPSLAHHARAVQRRHLPQRSQPVRLGGGDRSVQSAFDYRSSAPRSDASNTRGRGCRRRRTGRSSSIWAMTSGTSTSTAMCRTCRGEWRAERGSIPSTTAFSTSPSSTPTAPASGSR